MKIKIAPTPLKAMIALLLLVAQSFIQKLAISESIPFLKIIDELVVLYCLPFAIRIGFILFNKNQLFKGFFFLITIYWFLAITSSLFGVGTLTQALYQFVLDSKYIVIFLYCYGAYREGITEKYITKFFKLFVLINIPFVLMQILVPDIYDAVFPTGAHKGEFFTGKGYSLTRAAGVFWFTGQLAFFAALSSGFFLIKLWKLNVSKSNYIYLFLSLLLLISTISRGEIASFIISAAITYLFFISNKKIRYVHFVFILSIMALAISTNMNMFEKIFVEIGVTEIAAGVEIAPRAQMMSSAISEANENFPLGAGLGTLGGQAAVVYDSDLYYKHGFQHLWYFNHGLFLTDTYWPKVFAETGWIGAILLMFAYLYYPIKYLSQSNKLCFAGTFSFFAMMVLLINSFTSPVYNSVELIFMVLFLIGFDNHKNKIEIKINSNV